jgi:hypothetical protein
MICKSLSQLQAKLKKYECSYDEYCIHWNTLHYFWTIHKCGIMVICKDQTIDILPFVNDRFDNRLSWTTHDLTFELDGIQMNQTEYYREKAQRHNIEESRIGIHADQTKWWLNGHLLCNTKDEWSTRGLDTLLSMLQATVTRNCVFFFNRRDFPVHHKTGSSFVSAFGPSHQVPMFHNRQLSTIFSFYGSSEYYDKLWPPFEHWNINVPYVEKIYNRAVFRGTLTGKSFNEDNPRLFLARLRDPNINAGLTAWTQRDRIINSKVHYFGPSVFLSQPMSIEEQCRYSIILYVDGHVSSSRLLWNLLSGSLVIYIKSDCEAPLQWLHMLSQPLTDGIHYVSCLKEDVSKIVKKYLTDDARIRIGLEAREWALKAVSGMSNYCRSILP